MNAEKATIFKGQYFGQEPPGRESLIFAEGFVSTPANEHGCAFSPDGKEFYFTRIIDKRPTIMVTRQLDSGWTEPGVASFSGRYNDRLPSLSPDGRNLFFESIRPWPDSTGDESHHAWCVTRTGEDWATPYPLMLSLKQRLAGLSVSSEGRLYTGGITVFSKIDNRFVDPRPAVPYLEGDYPFIASDESYLLYCVGPRRNLAVSYRMADGSWSQPVTFTHENTFRIQGFPTVSPDGKYIFYTANHDIYWIDAGILDELRPENTKK
ncbi:MAG: PD40 domain-containing protein [candidate division Zixibacteria bacterium]|nr:PD40 domain-containing protein [candidate division Zixibacteria bacterium]